MPDYVEIIAVRPGEAAFPAAVKTAMDAGNVPTIAAGDADHTWSTLEECLGEIGQEFPSFELDVLFDGGRSWFGLAHMGLVRGQIVNATVSLSRASDRYVDPDAVAAPELGIELDVDADALVDEVRTASDRGGLHAEGSTIRLPYAYDDRDAALTALASVAAHLACAEARVLIEIENVFYRATLTRDSGAKLDPLFVWMDDVGMREWARSKLDAPGAASDAKAQTTKRDYTPAEPRRALVTGSARGRLTAAWELYEPTILRNYDGVETRSRAKEAAPRAVEQFVEALGARENAGEAFAEVRKCLYGYLAEIAPAVTAAKILVAALDTESEALRCEIYDQLSRLDTPAAHSALVFGFKHDSLKPRGVIRSVVWRNMPAIALLVQSELVPSWKSEGPDSDWCERILSMLRDEHVPVPRAWLAEAPSDLCVAVPLISD